jgi:hypothetical protein
LNTWRRAIGRGLRLALRSNSEQRGNLIEILPHSLQAFPKSWFRHLQSL